eukprot:SAG11_NODE_29954_length_305_cov_1.237864_1_plen_45_part_10
MPSLELESPLDVYFANKYTSMDLLLLASVITVLRLAPPRSIGCVV